MRALTEQDIRNSFVNCSKGEAKRLAVPRDLGERPWDDLDFLGWRDPGAPDRSYLVREEDDGRLTGVALRFQPGRSGFLQRSLCALCLTTHPRGGVSLMTARKAGPAGREGNSVGLYMCTTWPVRCTCGARRCRRAVPASRRAVPGGADRPDHGQPVGLPRQGERLKIPDAPRRTARMTVPAPLRPVTVLSGYVRGAWGREQPEDARGT